MLVHTYIYHIFKSYPFKTDVYKFIYPKWPQEALAKQVIFMV